MTCIGILPELLDQWGEVFFVVSPALFAGLIDRAADLYARSRADVGAGFMEPQALFVELKPEMLDERTRAGFGVGDEFFVDALVDFDIEGFVPVIHDLTMGGVLLPEHFEVSGVGHIDAEVLEIGAQARIDGVAEAVDDFGVWEDFADEAQGSLGTDVFVDGSLDGWFEVMIEQVEVFLGVGVDLFDPERGR